MRGRLNKSDTKMFDSIAKATIKCKCGHSIVMSYRTNKIICRWCNNYVYRTKKLEFLDKLVGIKRSEEKTKIKMI